MSSTAFSPRFRVVFHLVFGGLTLSGFGWMASHWLGAVEGEFGSVPSPLEPLWLKVHGAAAMAALLVLGAVLATHVPTNWKRRVNRRSGVGLWLILLVLILTGYGLYYAGGEGLRAWTWWIHLGLGSVLPVAIFGHIQLGRRRRRGKALEPLPSVKRGAAAPKE